MKLVKIVTTIPPKDADMIREVLAKAGAGVIGDYDHCSISTVVMGRSLPQKGANPHIGQVGKLEEIVEEKIETVVERSKAKKVIAALKKAHPYEEPIIEIHPLLTEEEL